MVRYDILKEAVAAMEDGKNYRISVNDVVSASRVILNRIGSVQKLNGHTLKLVNELIFADEIDCRDLFQKIDSRERIVIFEL